MEYIDYSIAHAANLAVYLIDSLFSATRNQLVVRTAVMRSISSAGLNQINFLIALLVVPSFSFLVSIFLSERRLL